MGIQTKSMKAGDPGIGFKLAISDDGDGAVDLSKDLSITAVVTEPAIAQDANGPAVPAKTHTFNMTVGQPLTTTEDLVFVLSYCSSSYGRETTVDVDITVSQGGSQVYNSGITWHSTDANPDKTFKLELE